MKGKDMPPVIPPIFSERLRKMLGNDEYERFISSLSDKRDFGLRANTLKISPESLASLMPVLEERIPWTQDGFYYPAEFEPGKCDLYNAGLFYIQEPSAMLAVSVAGIDKGMRVLDMCASPGGKSIQAAAALAGNGVLVCNDINPARISSLIGNIEMYGVRDSVVFNTDPEALKDEFPEYFDRILIDAPCSGEGMFRKDPASVKSYNNFGPDHYTALQGRLIDNAYEMLAPGGRIIYSTCTFNTDENEAVVDGFLKRHADCQPMNVFAEGAVTHGFEPVPEALRIWPHIQKGEGHFVCVVQKQGKISARALPEPEDGYVPAEYTTFETENLNKKLEGIFFRKGAALHMAALGYEGRGKVRYVKRGLYLGDIRNGRFEPSGALLAALKASDLKRCLDFAPKSQEMSKYLRGDTLEIRTEKGYVAILCAGYTVGWAKQSGGILKNLFERKRRRLR